MPTDLQVKRMIRPCFFVRIAAGVSLPAVLLLLPQPSGAAEPDTLGAEPFAGAAAFFEKHCLACHDADDPSGNLDLSALAAETTSPAGSASTTG
jgi:mono/diheme cytochrome c family protein